MTENNVVNFPSTVNPEHAFAGALLNLPCAEANELVGLVGGKDIADEHAALVHMAAMELTAHDRDPDPVAVLAIMRERGVYPEANRLQLFGQAILRFAERCPHPFSGRYYAQLVVADAYRRQVEAFGQRCAQIAQIAPLVDIDANLREWVESLRETRRRLARLDSVVGGAL